VAVQAMAEMQEAMVPMGDQVVVEAELLGLQQHVHLQDA
jgi:hypothetical protein